MTLYRSILADVDDTINSADIKLDPFICLDVTKIKTNQYFAELLPLNDIALSHNLYTLTSNCNINDYDIETPDFIISSTLSEQCIRLAWYICNEILYGDWKNSNSIDLSHLLNTKEPVRLYKYTIASNTVQNRIAISLSNGAELIIYHKNKI